MRMRTGIRAATLVVAAVVVIAGCSGGSALSASTPGAGKKGCQAVTGGKVTVVTKEYNFDPDCLKLAGSSLTVTYDNDEASIPHNFHLKGAKNAAGESSTKVKPGKNEQTITFVGLTPGTYTYVCDIHTNMVGHLTVTK